MGGGGGGIAVYFSRQLICEEVLFALECSNLKPLCRITTIYVAACPTFSLGSNAMLTL